MWPHCILVTGFLIIIYNKVSCTAYLQRFEIKSSLAIKKDKVGNVEAHPSVLTVI